jgi:hypothetical protein
VEQEPGARSVWALLWFLQQATFVNSAYAPAALALLGLPFAVMIALRPRQAFRRLWWLVVLPAPWIFIGLWAGWFWREPSSPPNLAWVNQAVGWALLGEIVSVVVLTATMRGARAFTAAFGFVNAYLTLFHWFMAAMAMSGIWL